MKNKLYKHYYSVINKSYRCEEKEYEVTTNMRGSCFWIDDDIALVESELDKVISSFRDRYVMYSNNSDKKNFFDKAIEKCANDIAKERSRFGANARDNYDGILEAMKTVALS